MPRGGSKLLPGSHQKNTNDRIHSGHIGQAAPNAKLKGASGMGAACRRAPGLAPVQNGIEAARIPGGSDNMDALNRTRAFRV